jgi:integrase
VSILAYSSSAIGSDAKCEPFLIGRRVDLPGQPWRPGMKTAAMRKRLAELRDLAVQKIIAQARTEPNLVRVGELEDLARELAATSPHRLRHGLAYRLLESGATPAYIKTIFGHSRITTSLMYGKPTEEDVRAALARANSRRSRS